MYVIDIVQNGSFVIDIVQNESLVREILSFTVNVQMKI
jgi:hypothetical protein